MIDVLMLTKNDWANTGWRFSQCLESLGLEVLFFKANTHSFFYPQQGLLHPALTKRCNESSIDTQGTAEKGDSLLYYVPELKTFVENARVVHFRDSTLIDTGVDLTKKKVVVQHGGRTYRVAHETINTMFNEFADAALIQMPDLLNLGANNEHLIYYPVDTKRLQPKYKRNHEKLIIGHFPTAQINKGSVMIVQTLKKMYDDMPEFKEKFAYMGPEDFIKTRDWLLVWTEHLKRVAYCDVIIETIAMEVQNRPFGEWGNQAIEAAALGKIVITNSQSTELYKKEYGPDCALNIANNENELQEQLVRILSMTDDEILKEKQRTRAWVEKYHSMEATAARLKEKIYKHLI